MTKAATQYELIAGSLRHIGQGLLDLADALVPSGASEPEPRPAARSQSKPPPAEEPSEDDEAGQDEVKLKDLQTLAKDLIKKGGRAKLVKILEGHELENVSSAPVNIWKTLKAELEAASE